MPTPTLQWQLSTDGGNNWNNINGATATDYTTPATAVVDSGKQYRAVATNSAGTTNSSAATLTVNPIAVIPRFAYVANGGSNTVSVYTINATTGALTEVGTPVAAGSTPRSVTTTGVLE